MIQVGERAPDLQIPLPCGGSLSLRQPGRPVIIAFVLKADSPVCSAELNQFKTNIADFDRKNALVVGVSREPDEALVEYQSKCQLPFPLISDLDGKLTRAFGVPLLGGLVKMAQRATFVINADGEVVVAFRSLLRIELHVQAALAGLAKLTVSNPIGSSGR